ncbi:type II secretion system protein [Cupriavidus pauculus]|uniref:Type II secretion system protein n=1 Tax=Cupriavidus pauculus TaxID=82633 RepID=A0A2N5CBW6_9BURK|nr:type II secretion system protein [Cupriavidus pauculus]PLP99717.1 hypothetical protein CYJ10_15105 [Cupriavidus pauculus]
MARRSRISSAARRRGFALVLCLVAVAVTGIYLMKVGDVWRMRAQREREITLHHVGREIQVAIRRYVENGDGSYPRTLDDLVEDLRGSQPRRWLRRAWRDPMTGGDWQYLPAPGDGFLGVHSLSTLRPLRQGNFAVEEAAFAQAGSYADWRFAYWPGQPDQD